MDIELLGVVPYMNYMQNMKIFLSLIKVNENTNLLEEFISVIINFTPSFGNCLEASMVYSSVVSIAPHIDEITLGLIFKVRLIEPGFPLNFCGLPLKMIRYKDRFIKNINIITND